MMSTNVAEGAASNLALFFSFSYDFFLFPQSLHIFVRSEWNIEGKKIYVEREMDRRNGEKKIIFKRMLIIWMDM